MKRALEEGSASRPGPAQPLCPSLAPLYQASQDEESVCLNHSHLFLLSDGSLQVPVDPHSQRISAPDCLSLAELGRQFQRIYMNTHILPYFAREKDRLFCFPLGNRNFFK